MKLVFFVRCTHSNDTIAGLHSLAYDKSAVDDIAAGAISLYESDV